MARKRELTVERWSENLATERELIRQMDDATVWQLLKYHVDAGHDLKDVVFEQQMALLWKECGMQVYDFDPDFTQSILNENWVDLLPDCIGNRPYDCFYMKLPCGKQNEGVVVFVVGTDRIDGFRPDWFPGALDAKGVYVGGNGEERTIVNTGEETLCLCYFAISKTIDLMFDDTPLERYPNSLVANGVAYLCSLNADITPVYKPQPSLRRNNAKRRSNATWYDVGARVGSELRAYTHVKSGHKPHQGGTVRPHMRRAHWHHFWTGPRDGARNLVLKWLPPTIVGAGKPDSPTLHKVG